MKPHAWKRYRADVVPAARPDIDQGRPLDQDEAALVSRAFTLSIAECAWWLLFGAVVGFAIGITYVGGAL